MLIILYVGHIFGSGIIAIITCAIQQVIVCFVPAGWYLKGQQREIVF
jgi:hypothetical protein